MLKGLGDQMKQVVAWAEAHGWDVGRCTSNHLRMTHPCIKVVVFSSATPSCPHAKKNAIAQMRRLMRAHGVDEKRDA